MHQASTPSVQVGQMFPRCSKKQKTAADADANDGTNLAQLPSDVLACILLCLPASDLRRSRRVCKEWRDVISDPSFIDSHMVHGPRGPPTHTIVFYPGRRQADRGHAPLSGGGFLFDEQWRLAARFTVNESAEMIGTCKGLLCFRDSAHGVIKVVEPFTGESTSVPLPPTSHAGTCSTAAYCFGFDATARRYKIVHGAFEGKVNYDGYIFPPSMESTVNVKQELHVFTVGADNEYWRSVHILGAPHGVLYGDPACDDRAVYWYSHNDGYYRNVRFDLATEKITSELRRLVASELSCSYWPVTFNPCVVGIRWFGEVQEDNGGWLNNIEEAAHETYSASQPAGWSLPGPHALQRGHLLLLRQKEGDLCARPILKSTMSDHDIGFDCYSKPLIVAGKVDAEQYSGHCDSKFVGVHRRFQDSSKVEVPMIGRLPFQLRAITAFPYVPTVSPAPFALYLGTPLKDLHKF